jgi:methyl-accepting chemotaxis protein
MHGTILRVAKHVQDEYEVITGGVELDLFLDNMKLKWGDKWRSRIRDAIENSTFFIPIITPRYFKSEACRDELLGFAEQAKALGREALIMPLYFVEVPELESGGSDDPAMQLVADSQMKDWRNLRLLDETTQPYRLALNELATELREVSREREITTRTRPAAAEEDQEYDRGGDLRQSTSEGHDLSPSDGYLEQLVEGEVAFPRLVETLNDISPEIEKIGDLAANATKEIEHSDASGGGFKGRLAITHRLAKELNLQADQLERLTSEYVADLLTVDPAMRTLIRMAADHALDNAQEAADFFSSIEEMIDSSDQAAEGISEMIESLLSAAKVSRELDKPLQRLRSSLQSMIDSNRRMETWRGDIEAARNASSR